LPEAEYNFCGNQGAAISTRISTARKRVLGSLDKGWRALKKQGLPALCGCLLGRYGQEEMSNPLFASDGSRPPKQSDGKQENRGQQAKYSGERDADDSKWQADEPHKRIGD
jgi:hypothetical protein